MPILSLDPKNLFPLFRDQSESSIYSEAQNHSREVDRYLGIQTLQTEARILDQSPLPQETENQNTWRGKSTDITMTPYSELRQILDRLVGVDFNGDFKIIDLGAGYGRLAFVLARHYPQAQFIGYELEAERVNEGMRCLLPFLKTLSPPLQSPPQLIHADLMNPDFLPDSADYYFIYDYGSRAAVNKTLNDLKKIATQQKIQVVGRGRLSRDLIELEHPWLSQVVKPRHFAHSSIYSSQE